MPTTYIGMVDNDFLLSEADVYSSRDVFAAPAADSDVFGVTFTKYEDMCLSTTTTFSTSTGTVGTRFGICKDYNFSPSTTTDPGVDDFMANNAGPFMIRECCTRYNSSTGKQEVVSYEGDSTWDTDKVNTDYNRMIEFPLFYYYRPSEYEFSVSSNRTSVCNTPSSMHYRNGKLYDKVYISKYHLNSSYKSVSGNAVLVSTALATYRTNVRSQGMYIMDYPAAMSITMLMFIKYASLHLQHIIGTGNSAKKNTGLCDNVLSKDGRLASATSTSSGTVTFGLENWWGNVATLVDGFFKNSSNKFVINPNIEGITANPNSSFSGYSTVSTAPATTSNYCQRLSFDSTFPYMIFPTTVAAVGKSSQDYYTYKSGSIAVLIGGYYGQAAKNGPLYLNASACALTSALAYVGVRSMCFSSTYT